MIDVYTRGAVVELARTHPVPSIGSRWHGGSRTSVDRPRPAPPTTPPARAATPVNRKLSADDVLRALKRDPEQVVRLLVEALSK